VAVAIATTAGHRLDWGAVNRSGLTALTFALTFKFNAAPSSRRICGQWTGAGTWLCQMIGDELGFVVNGPSPCGVQTDSVDFADGGLYRVVMKLYDLAGTPARKVFVNGTSVAVSIWIANNVGAIGPTGGDLRIGDTDGNVPEAADYSEFAVWNSELPDADCAAYGKGLSPLLFSVKPTNYARLTNVSDIRDIRGGLTGTNSSGTSASHPRMIYPRRRSVVPFAAAAAAGDAVPVCWAQYRRRAG